MYACGAQLDRASINRAGRGSVYQKHHGSVWSAKKEKNKRVTAVPSNGQRASYTQAGRLYALLRHPALLCRQYLPREDRGLVSRAAHGSAKKKRKQKP